MHSDAFDVIPYDDIKGDWKKLGSGSFGNVYKGNYLGIDVAIKEVLPSTDYDVSKYFEREWRLMKECRHPNICLFIGLSRGPPPPSTNDPRHSTIYIVSEFVDGGNVRSYIHNRKLPFPWRLRLSFATDIARALAYLHARQCIHRDLKGENLLVTSNGRIKVTDFGFARIAARNEDELRRLTFCGTDSYMSPEILLGDEFSLPTDIFSLGVIFCEILARKLADDKTFKRTAPTFGIDEAEVHKLKDKGCPEGFRGQAPASPASSNCVTYTSSLLYSALPTVAGPDSPTSTGTSGTARPTGSTTRTTAPGASQTGDAQNADAGNGASTLAISGVSILGVVFSALFFA
ncbi:hypothetical protein NMY22_g4599 [Coprinellus aureogranulatus]|nr:hypothetical protein NMY22_g4599 [Coprinellus aureogranulatus]